MVKRYDRDCDNRGVECCGWMDNTEDGDYVTYYDYQKLKASHDELLTVLNDIQSMGDSSLWEQNDTVSYIAKFARQAINKAREVMDEM